MSYTTDKENHMCDTCHEIAASHIMDYVNLGLSLPVAIRMERDAVVQRALMDGAGAEAHENAVELSKTITDAGEQLVILAEHFPKTWAVLLDQRKAEFEHEKSEAGQ